MKTALGTHTFSDTSGWLHIETVAIPNSSNLLCSRLTDRMQSGQTGMRKAASTPSECIFSAMRGAVFFIRGWKLGV